MRFRLEATSEELAERSDSLIEQLCKALEPVVPGTAEILRKAVPSKKTDLDRPVLQQIAKTQRAEYARLNRLMLDKILKVLERAGAK